MPLELVLYSGSRLWGCFQDCELPGLSDQPLEGHLLLRDRFPSP